MASVQLQDSVVARVNSDGAKCRQSNANEFTRGTHDRNLNRATPAAAVPHPLVSAFVAGFLNSVMKDLRQVGIGAINWTKAVNSGFAGLGGGVASPAIKKIVVGLFGKFSSLVGDDVADGWVDEFGDRIIASNSGIFGRGIVDLMQ